MTDEELAKELWIAWGGVAASKKSFLVVARRARELLEPPADDTAARECALAFHKATGWPEDSFETFWNTAPEANKRGWRAVAMAKARGNGDD